MPWTEVMVILVGFVLVLLGLTFFLYRRRDEILEEIFTPEESELDQEFFKRIEEQQKQLETVEAEPSLDEVDSEGFEWGDLPPGIQ